MTENLHLEKAVLVSDPLNWYEQEMVSVEMFPLPTEPGTIRIVFKSIDDFMVYMDFCEWDLEANWRWCETWLWGTIPSTVNCAWLYKHGYRPF